ncbi:S28 family serine protease [Nocardioides convexus]|uniref:S28 family serine protease n=1 Tax=Nocardioides convexus TaxID=2712224 RepID=UPI00241832AA|nr:S28 family serine protease [Nocardioides convexus]
MPRLRSALGVLLTTVVATTGLTLSPAVSAPPSAPAAPAQAPAAADIRDQVAALPGVTSVTEATAPAGYRFFKITFRQPVDHRHPRAGTFEQRLSLLHKDTARPMVMYTSGYNLSANPSRSEPTQIVDGNQAEHGVPLLRAIDPREAGLAEAGSPSGRPPPTSTGSSSPSSGSTRRAWITTGGSKGGMTATYHRRFFPNDVDGTVPYVAPNDVDNDRDAYNSFLANVGTDPACRTALTAVQRRILGPDRAWFLERTRQDAEATGDTWQILGSLDRGMETAVIDLYFTFWQYSPQSACAAVPGASATNEQVWDWTQGVVPLTSLSGPGPARHPRVLLPGGLPDSAGTRPTRRRSPTCCTTPAAGAARTSCPPSSSRSASTAARCPTSTAGCAPAPRTCSTSTAATTRGAPSSSPAASAPSGASAPCTWSPAAPTVPGSPRLPEAERLRVTAQILDWAGLGASDKASKAVAGDGRPVRNARLDRTPDYLRPLGR